MQNKKIQFKQRDITDCGAACLASIASHHGYKMPISRIRQYASTDKKGTNVLGMVEAAERLGFIAKGVKGPFESLFKIPKPAIAHIVVKEVLHHYVVIYKVTKKYIIVMDPADGEIHKIKHEAFKKEWTGVLILLVPSEKFERGDETTSALSRFWNLVRPHKSVMVEALLGAIVITILGLSMAIYVQKIVDYVIVDGNRNLLNLMSVIMIGLLLIRVFISFMKGVFVLRTGQKIDVQLILGYYKHLLTLPQRFFDTMRIGEIVSRLNDAVKIRSFINDVSLDLIVNVLVIIFSFSLMFIYSWKIDAIMAIVIPIYAFIYYIVNKINKKYQREMMENAAELESQLVESLNSMSTVKRFGLEWYANIKTETRFVKLLETVYHSGINALFAGNSTSFVSSLFTILLLWIGTVFVIDNTITPGELMSCYALIGYFTEPVSSLINVNRTVQDALIASDRLFEIMDLEREQSEGTIILNQEMIGNICFKDISFRYGTRVNVFEQLNLSIPKGKITGIVGESGSGKTTLLSLIQKIYPVREGQIFIGDHDIQYINNESLRHVISVVPQKIDIFAGSVIENIAVGDFEPDQEKIIKICNEIGIKDFINKLPNGFQTYLGENGANLSGGEKQRIAIARALYKSPEILILDEATSSLDSASEGYIRLAVRALRKKGKTVIVIAHRLSTIMHADKILVLKDGLKIEEGRHEDLLQKKGAYYSLWKYQFPVIEQNYDKYSSPESMAS
ncbi:peptidase domain-containing ABC transporter [Desulfobacterales bacterium HSG17]|nr:peptidase domain-containing ABC transporter [Desulfobacterales bacterium HSG17]